MSDHTKTRASHSILLTVVGVILVACSVITNIIFQNGDEYTNWYLAIGIPGVLLIVWNGPKWLHEYRTPRN
ncbi:hypothetical protein IPM44_01805 [bacterium]|nr:MAG: hypothetical protein IPM44_01805 [bacterium]